MADGDELVDPDGKEFVDADGKAINAPAAVGDCVCCGTCNPCGEETAPSSYTIVIDNYVPFWTTCYEETPVGIRYADPVDIDINGTWTVTGPVGPFGGGAGVDAGYGTDCCQWIGTIPIQWDYYGEGGCVGDPVNSSTTAIISLANCVDCAGVASWYIEVREAPHPTNYSGNHLLFASECRDDPEDDDTYVPVTPFISCLDDFPDFYETGTTTTATMSL